MKLPLVKPNIDGAKELLVNCAETGWVSSQGSYVKQFENEFAEWLGVKHAVSCSSGTAALHLALTACGISACDRVLVPSFTFIATANAVMYCNATPVLQDIHNDTWCLDVKTPSHFKAIVPVHLNGYPCDMRAIMKLARANGAWVIEDACQSLGSTYGDRPVGTIGDIGCFSFFGNKLLTTGEGGMAVTNSDRLARKMRVFRDHGRSKGKMYVHDVIGFNYRMTNLQAAVGLVQIPRLAETIIRRKMANEKWRRVIGHTQPTNIEQCPWLYHYKVNSRLEVIELLGRLEEAGIEARPFYKPIHQQRPYRPVSGKFTITNSLYGIMLPLHDGVTEEHIDLVKNILA
jgi:perosamine synthetase